MISSSLGCCWRRGVRGSVLITRAGFGWPPLAALALTALAAENFLACVSSWQA